MRSREAEGEGGPPSLPDPSLTFPALWGRGCSGGNPSALDPQRVQSPGTHGHLPQGQSSAHKGMQAGGMNYPLWVMLGDPGVHNETPRAPWSQAAVCLCHPGLPSLHLSLLCLLACPDSPFLGPSEPTRGEKHWQTSPSSLKLAATPPGGVLPGSGPLVPVCGSRTFCA